MPKRTLPRRCALLTLAALIITAFGVCAHSDYPDNEKEYFCWTGLGIFTGNVTYQIGGHFVDPSQQLDEIAPFPVSKLQFPLNVTIVTFGNEFSLNKHFEIRGEVTKNITTYAGKMSDTDYLYPGQLTQIYSSNDSDVQTITTDIGFRYWVSRQDAENMHIKFGLGGAMLYEHFEWRLSNLNQFNYYDDNGNQIIPAKQTVQSGLIGAYESTTNMPYLEAATEFDQTDAFSLLISVGYSPFAQVSDEDNHILRQFAVTTNLTGSAYKLCVEAKYNLSKSWILMGKWDWISFNLTGTDSAFFYGTANKEFNQAETWTYQHEISSTQSILTFSLAKKF